MPKGGTMHTMAFVLLEHFHKLQNDILVIEINTIQLQLNEILLEIPIAFITFCCLFLPIFWPPPKKQKNKTKQNKTKNICCKSPPLLSTCCITYIVIILKNLTLKYYHFTNQVSFYWFCSVCQHQLLGMSWVCKLDRMALPTAMGIWWSSQIKKKCNV